MTFNFSTQQEMRSAKEHRGFVTYVMGGETRIQLEVKRIAKAAMRPFLRPKVSELAGGIIN